MPTRESILRLVRAGRSYPQIARQLGITPGLAYLVATGLPADGGDAPGPGAEPEHREGVLPGSTQHLANPGTVITQTDDSVGDWIRRRAAADPALRAAWAEHSVVPPEPTADSDDLVDLLGQDHAQLRYLQQELQTLPGAAAGGLPDDLRRRAEALALLRTRLSVHERAEQQVFWPFVRERFDDGDDLARDGQDQERKLEQLLAAIDAATPAEHATSRYDDLIGNLVSALRKHVAFEERILARIYDDTDEGERTGLGRRYKAARAGRGAAQTAAKARAAAKKSAAEKSAADKNTATAENSATDEDTEEVAHS